MHDSLSDRAYEGIRRRIIEVELQPGARLVERDLAAELEVSRIPLREALKRLAAEGLVVLVPRRGALVSPFSPAQVRDLFDLRESLEVLAARLAAERADPAGLELLAASLEAARQATATGDQVRIAAANAAFHAAVVQASGNELLVALMGPLNARLHWLFRLTAERDAGQQCAEHAELYEAIAAHDPARAAAQALHHVASGREPTLALAAGWSHRDIDPLEVTHGRRRRPALGRS